MKYRFGTTPLTMMTTRKITPTAVTTMTTTPPTMIRYHFPTTKNVVVFEAMLLTRRIFFREPFETFFSSILFWRQLASSRSVGGNENHKSEELSSFFFATGNSICLWHEKGSPSLSLSLSLSLSVTLPLSPFLTLNRNLGSSGSNG